MQQFGKYQKLSPLAHDAVRWKPGFWGDLHTLCRDTVLPSMRNALNDDSNGAHFINFYLAAGLQQGQRIGTNWSDGDRLELHLPMRPRLIKAHPKAEEVRNHIAVMRGPLVYCLESFDLPDDASILDVYAPDDMGLQAEMSDLLGGLGVLGVRALRVDESSNGALYREAGGEQGEALDITLILYYAWNNRGVGEMTVWLPRRY